MPCLQGQVVCCSLWGSGAKWLGRLQATPRGQTQGRTEAWARNRLQINNTVTPHLSALLILLEAWFWVSLPSSGDAALHSVSEAGGVEGSATVPQDGPSVAATGVWSSAALQFAQSSAADSVQSGAGG